MPVEPEMTDSPRPSESSEAPAPTFDDLQLPPALRRAVAALGFERPSPIQAQAIPSLLDGRDVIGVAQTGTGKTAAFGLPLLAAVDASERSVQALVLAPTRELAMQVADAIGSFASASEGLEVVPVYGGSPYHPQERALSRGAQVVVGTPGRVMDHIRRGSLRLDGIRYAVLDEADEMLRMGFAEDVEEILSHSPATKQTALFSATMPPAIQKVAAEHMNDPVRVTVARQSSTVSSVTQRYAVVPFRHKTGALARVLATSDAQAAIVFVRTRSAAEEVGAELISRGLVAATISGDVPQKERERIVERLRDGSLQVLVATDVAARGLDVDRIGLVVNFDVPGEPEAYVHRIGRTGRAGRSGEALTFVAPHERRKLRAIEKTTRQELEEIQIPSPRDVSRHRLRKLLGEVPARAEAGRLDLALSLVDEFLESSEMDARTLAAVLGAMSVGDSGPQAAEEEEFRGASLKGSDRDRGDRHDRGDRRDRGERPSPGHPEKGYTTYRIGVGHSHGAKPPAIVGTITGEGGLNGKDVGKIDIFGSFSLVQVRGSLSGDQLDRVGRAKIAGRTLRISEDRGPRTSGPRSGAGEGQRSRYDAKRDRRGGKPFHGGRDEGARPYHRGHRHD
ncbi:DEAD/DEAH box helicase [Brachybacterium hainanense]|uniref:RNA helicase n=1 Tax=Brachybacterium hainanense TaxID=1541174 RepID=A0ABV6RHF6_9MICO